MSFKKCWLGVSEIHANNVIENRQGEKSQNILKYHKASTAEDIIHCVIINCAMLLAWGN